MSIIVDGAGGQRITVDVFTYRGEDLDRGRGFVRVSVPRGSVTRLEVDEDEADWIEAQVLTEREDQVVEVSLSIEADEVYPCCLAASWGEDREVVRGPSNAGAKVLLDGVPRRIWLGMLERAGGPEVAGDGVQAAVAAGIRAQGDVASPFGPEHQASVG